MSLTLDLLFYVFLTPPAIAGILVYRMKSCRAPFLLCLVSLAGAATLFAVGKYITLWIVGRVLQGISAGTLWGACLALLADTVGTEGLGQAVGLVGYSMATGPIIGTMVGGVVYDHGGYLAVFGPIFVMLGMAALLMLAMIERKIAQTWLEADDKLFEGNARTDISVSSMARPTSSDMSPTMTDESDELTLKVPNAGQGFLHHLHTAIMLLASRKMMLSLAGGFLQSFLNVAFDSTLPLEVNTLFGWQQTGQGLIFIPILLPCALQPCFGRICDKYHHGKRLLAAAGLILSVPAYISLGFVTQDNLGQKAIFCILLLVIGTCMSMAMPAIMAEIGSLVENADKQNPQAVIGFTTAWTWSLATAAFAGGALFGPLFAGFIRNAAGWQTTTWSLGLVSAFTGVLMLLFLGGWIGKIHAKAPLSRRTSDTCRDGNV